MKKADYTNKSQQRVLKILKILAGHLDGLTVTQIALLTNSTPPEVTKDLYNLELAGFAERDGEFWMHGKAVIQMYRIFANSLEARLILTFEKALEVLMMPMCCNQLKMKSEGIIRVVSYI